MQQAVVAAYARHDFPEIVQRVQNFCTNEMGALYLDITKDRLYTMPADSRGRRSAQSAMYRILEAMVRWLAPILSFHGRRNLAVLLVPGEPAANRCCSKPGTKAWRRRRIRSSSAVLDRSARDPRGQLAQVARELRANGEIGSSLDAEVTCLSRRIWTRYAAVRDELRFFFITSALNLASSGGRAYSFSRPAERARKCIRCWHHRPDVGVEPRAIPKFAGVV